MNATLSSTVEVLDPRPVLPRFPTGLVQPWHALYRHGRFSPNLAYRMLNPAVILIGLYLLIWRIVFLVVGTSLWVGWTVLVATAYIAVSTLSYISTVAYHLAQLTYRETHKS